MTLLQKELIAREGKFSYNKTNPSDLFKREVYVQTIIKKESSVGDFLEAINSLRLQLEKEGYKGLYEIKSHPSLVVQAQIEKHFFAITSTTEYQRVLENKHIHGWTKEITIPSGYIQLWWLGNRPKKERKFNIQLKPNAYYITREDKWIPGTLKRCSKHTGTLARKLDGGTFCPRCAFGIVKPPPITPVPYSNKPIEDEYIDLLDDMKMNGMFISKKEDKNE